VEVSSNSSLDRQWRKLAFYSLEHGSNLPAMTITVVCNGAAAVKPQLGDDGRYRAHNLIMIFSDSMALKAVLKLGIPDILAAEEDRRSLSVSEILERLPMEFTPGPNSSINLRRIITPLVREGFFSESVDENKEPAFGLTDVSKYFVKGNEMNMLAIAGKVIFASEVAVGIVFYQFHKNKCRNLPKS
jgi:hypothetical protein